jgi:hypothetical protein
MGPIQEDDMGVITRRSLILSGASLATGAFVAPTEAATGSVALHIASAGFIFGVTGGSGTLTFRDVNIRPLLAESERER